MPTPNLTDEQQLAVDYTIKAPKGSLVLIDSVAGSGKTTLLTSIAEGAKGGQALYLAYNKAIATSSSRKFPNNVDCRTTHSLAFKATVAPLKLQVGFFGVKDIYHKIPQSEKYTLVEDLREFCLSKYLTYDEFAEEYGRPNAPLVNEYLTLMSEGKIEVTHDFYLKLFHILLHNKEIAQVDYNLIMLDEAGDLNEVTLEIFKLLSGDVKVAVGDPHQNIYTFNHTINCFAVLSDQGKTFNLSKSFRVPESIAGPVQGFCRKYLNPSMKFVGVDVEDRDIVTRGYVSRTNGGLIDKLIELNQEGTPYGLVRKAQEIFKVPLMVAGLKYQGKIYDPAYRHIQEDVDSWFENDNNVKTQNPSLIGYLRSKHSEDLALVQALNLVTKHGRGGIFEAYAEAKNHENKKQNFMLLTAHSSKGLEFDEVVLAPDMNTSVDKVLEAIAEGFLMEDSVQAMETFNLYYVACTRALVRLRNAIHLVV